MEVIFHNMFKKALSVGYEIKVRESLVLNNEIDTQHSKDMLSGAGLNLIRKSLIVYNEFIRNCNSGHCDLGIIVYSLFPVG